jgi:hypothetical protein
MQTNKPLEIKGAELLRVADMNKAVTEIDFKSGWDDKNKREIYKSWFNSIVIELSGFLEDMDREGELRGYTERQADIYAIANALKVYVDNQRHQDEIDYLRYEIRDHGKRVYTQIGTFFGLLISGVAGAVIQEISSENGKKIGNILSRFYSKFAEIVSDYPIEMSGTFFTVLIGICLNWKIKGLQMNSGLNKFIKPGNDDFVWELLAYMHQVDEDKRRRYIVLGRMFRRIVEYRKRDAVKEALEKANNELSENQNLTKIEIIQITAIAELAEMKKIMSEISEVLKK